MSCGIFDFFPEKFDELCIRIRLLFQEKKSENDTDRFDDEIVGLYDELLNNKYLTEIERKNVFEPNIKQ